ncbi:MAG: polysaccharide biosynthesis C-terminal domain-containing protein [Gemmatimonadota bacterium]
MNTAGLAVKLVQPLLILVLTWLYGPEVMGVFFVAVFLLDLLTGLAAWGFVDAATLFTSRALEDGEPGHAAAHHTLGAAIRWGVGLSLAAAVALGAAAGMLASRIYPDLPGLATALRILAAALPLMAWTQLAIGGTKAHMRMEYDAAILGFVNPVLRLLFAAAAWWIWGTLPALMASILTAEVATAATAGWALSRHFRLQDTLAAVLSGPPVPGLLPFALPQSANVTLNRYLTRIDVLMLGAFGVPSGRLAYYATAALISSNLRQIRLVFSSALAPVAARHHARGEALALEEVLNRLSRWTTTLIIPVVLTLTVLREDVLRLFDASYSGESVFIVVLLIAPLVGSSLGLFGNAIIYTGHSAWTLGNSLLVAALNTAFNLVMIPRWGLLGAAMGTAGAATIIALLQVLELRMLEGIRLRLRAFRQPLLGLLAAGAALALLWDPASLGPGFRLATAVGLPAGFLFLQALLGHPEVTARFRDRAA